MTSPNESVPPGSANETDFSNWAAKTGDDWKDEATSATNNAWGKPRGFGAFLSSVMQGLVSGIGGAFGFLSGLFELRWAQVDNHEDDLGNLQSRTQYLEGVIGFAHSYASTDLSLTTGDMKRPMSNQIGPAQGVSLTSGSFILGTRGLWVADAHQTFDGYPIGAQDIWTGIRVYTPGGSLYSERYTHATESAVTSLNVHLPFTTPTAGYRVEMWVHAALARGIWGGSLNNGLSVYKESSETS